MQYISKSEKGIGVRIKDLSLDCYDDYLKSNHWKKFREDFYRNSPTVKRMYHKYGILICQFCSKKGILNLHHSSYKRLGRERIKDVVLICINCHKLIHSLDRKYDLYERTKQVRRSMKNSSHKEKAIQKVNLMKIK